MTFRSSPRLYCSGSVYGRFSGYIEGTDWPGTWLETLVLLYEHISSIETRREELCASLIVSSVDVCVIVRGCRVAWLYCVRAFVLPLM